MPIMPTVSEEREDNQSAFAKYLDESNKIQRQEAKWREEFERERYEALLAQEKRLSEARVQMYKEGKKLQEAQDNFLYNAQVEHEKQLQKLRESNASVDDIKAENDKFEKQQKNLKKLAELQIKNLKKIAEEQAKIDAARKKKQDQDARASKMKDELFGSGSTFEERMNAMRKVGTMSKDDEGTTHLEGVGALIGALGSLADSLKGTIQKVSSHKSGIDTRLQGSGNMRTFGSYWDFMSSDISSITGLSPFIKQETLINNLDQMVNRGISFDVEERAFLQTIKDKIATTFDANNGTLLKLIRIQQQDTTAGRLGMESALNAFLNHMYENTEYLNSVATSVKENIYEASALMEGAKATAFEYQVQKWLGSMYSVGMSDSAVGAISQALGQIAAGDISGLTGSKAGNLMVMAANNAGISIADILQNGLTDKGANELMSAMVSYLSGVYNQTSNSKVVRQQFANVYGLKASDLKAISNMAMDNKTIAGNNMNYQNMINRLGIMNATMGMRTDTGSMLNNLWENAQYSMAAGIANNPVLYALYNAAGMLDQFGGIAIPAFSVMGNMVDLETNVADLMRAGALGGSALGMMGNLISGMGSGLDPTSTLTRMLTTNMFGPRNQSLVRSIGRFTGGLGMLGANGTGFSEAGYVGNSDGGDVQNKTMTDAYDDGNKQLADKEEESTETKLSQVNDSIIKIYEMLNAITSANGIRVVLDENTTVWTRPTIY